MSCVKVRGSTGVYCIIGHPIAHSLSPAIHNTLFSTYGIDAVYVAFDVKPEALREALIGIKALDIRGCTVTIPHKEGVVTLLDEVDPVSQEIGAVNTIKNENGRLIGYNTDVWGFLEPLKGYAGELKGSDALLIGAGGAARAIVYAFKILGIGRLFIANRGEARGKMLEGFSLKMGLDAKYIGFDEKVLAKRARESKLIVNATPLGMHGVGGRVPVTSSDIRSDSIVYDIVYNPIETPLLVEARKAGARVISGVDMLIHQAVLAFKIWTGIHPKPEPLYEVVLKELKSKPC